MSTGYGRWFNEEENFCCCAWGLQYAPEHELHVEEFSTCSMVPSQLHTSTTDCLFPQVDGAEWWWQRKDASERDRRCEHDGYKSSVVLMLASMARTTGSLRGGVYSMCTGTRRTFTETLQTAQPYILGCQVAPVQANWTSIVHCLYVQLIYPLRVADYRIDCNQLVMVT